MAEHIPAMRLENEAVWEALQPRLKELVCRGGFTLGDELRDFEESAAEKFSCAWCVGTSSGTSALTLALRAAPLQAGARVAIPANSFFSTLEAVAAAGHIAVVVDHDEDYVISLSALEAVDVDAVIAVHLYGFPADMRSLMQLADERRWWVLEDCAQAHGATIDGREVGSFGHAGAFSAYPSKNLGAWGDAGFITGSDRELERQVRALRHHGQVEPNLHERIGGTERLDNIQALVLSEKLRRLDQEVVRRRRVADWYHNALASSNLPLPEDKGSRLHAYHQFVTRVPDRKSVRLRMRKAGVGSSIHYPTPIHLQPGAVGFCDVPVTPKRAEEWATRILSLPMYPALTEADVDAVAGALISAGADGTSL
jgi:dTDP-4-amino-4,6-dideoxygalactose transaminase